MEETWREAIEAVAYELARRNGESPLDRGAALRERGYRGEESGEESAARVYALVYGVVPTLVAA